MENFMVNINNLIENSYFVFTKDGVVYEAPFMNVLAVFLVIVGTVVVICSIWGWLCNIDDDTENINEHQPRIIKSNNQ